MPAFSGDLKGILKDVSRTLYLSIKILPDPLKTVMSMGYLVARAMDTIVDCPAIDAGAKIEMLRLVRSLENKNNAVALAALAQHASRNIPSQGEKKLLLKFEKIAGLYASFPEQELSLLKALVNGVAEGMEMDLEAFQGSAVSALKTEDEIKKYCALIGGKPGIFWARLYQETIRRNNGNIGKFPSETDAGFIGSALQMTNILKDLASDLRIGRCYLPQTDLDQVRLKPADLLKPENIRQMRPVVYKWISWTVDQLDLSESFISSIPKTELALRAAFVWPVYWAMDTLQEIAKANILEPSDRPKIKRARIYSTIASTPQVLLSNTAFARGYRFRRETLIVQISGK
jgi:farnesyl-diphosphate farnesyltransferase